MILSISFKMTAEIEIRKHKLIFCVLLRTTLRRSCVSFVSHMFFHCHEIRLHCFLLSIAWFQLALILSDCFELSFQSVKYGSIPQGSIVCRQKFHEKGILNPYPHPQWRSGYVRSGQPEGTRFKFCYIDLLFSLLPFFFLFCFVLFAYLFCCFFCLFFLFLNIYLNNC